MWVQFHKFENGLGKQRTERKRNADVQFACQHILEVVHLLRAIIDINYYFSCISHELLPGFGERNLVAVSLKQYSVEFVLKLAYLLREGALCNKQCLSRLREIRQFGHLEKVSYLSQLHSLPLSVCYIIFNQRHG